MPCDLQALFGQLADSLPMSSDGNDNVVLSRHTMPAPPAHLTSDRLYIRRTTHNYNMWFRADALWFYACEQTYRQLGLLILAVVFQPDVPGVDLELTHPASDIRHLCITYEHPNLNDVPPGYTTRPYALNYYPDEAASHPWASRGLAPSELPCFWLTNEQEFMPTEEDWARRDTVKGFGTDTGSVRFAALLLNLGCPQNAAREYALEGDAGVRGVGTMSAEARFILPGSVAWDVAQWPSPGT